MTRKRPLSVPIIEKYNMKTHALLHSATAAIIIFISQIPLKSQGYSIFYRNPQHATVVESWREGDQILAGAPGKPVVVLDRNGSPASKAITPPPPPSVIASNDPKGPEVPRFRQGAWWSLVERTGRHLQAQNRWTTDSTLLRWQPQTQTWEPWAKATDIEAAAFEPLDERRVLLLACHDTRTGERHLAGLLTPSGFEAREAPPYPKPEDRLPEGLDKDLWNRCLSSRDDHMVYAYFPGAGRLFGFDQETLACRTFKEPWPRLDPDHIREQLAKPHPRMPKLGRTLVLFDHPGLGEAYFTPMAPGSMAFVYRLLDHEAEQQYALASGENPGNPILVTRALRLSPFDSETLELTVQKPLTFEPWIWDDATATFRPIPASPKPAAKAKPALPERPGPSKGQTPVRP